MNLSNQDNNSSLERKQPSEDVSSELEPSDKQNNSDSDDLPELEPADEQNNSDSDVMPELLPADEQNNSDSDDLPELPADEQNNFDDRIYNYFRNDDRIYNDYRNNDRIYLNFNITLNRVFQMFNNIGENNYEEKNNEPKCTFCNSYYDHHNHSQYFMACCAKDYCLKCVKDFKETEKKECPKCHYSLKYLKDIELPTFDDVIPEEGEDCMICCYSMGTTQYNGKVTLECNCNLELCITCAYKSLKDAKHIKMENVQGLNGLVLPQEYIVKGSCPHCRQIPKNKDDIIALYNFLPPRY